MKKILITVTMALAMVAFAAPAFANDVYVSSGAELKEAAASAEDGDVIYLQNNITLSSPVIFDNAVTIDGTSAKYEINGIKSDVNFKVGADTTVQNLKLNATGNVSAIVVQGSGSAVKNCDINTELNGINFYATGLNNPTITITNCTIKNSLVSNYDRPVSYPNDSRGLSLNNVIEGNVDVDNCQIYGFAYSINALVDTAGNSNVRDGNGTVIDVTESTIKGWTALNMWSANTMYNFTDCNLYGINTYNSPYQNFSTIKLNDPYGNATNLDSTVTFNGGYIAAYQYGSSLETPFGTESEETKVQFNMNENGDFVQCMIYHPANVQPYFFTIPGGDFDNDYFMNYQVQGLDFLEINDAVISNINMMMHTEKESLAENFIKVDSWNGGNEI